jgi:hypothetical protein
MDSGGLVVETIALLGTHDTFIYVRIDAWPPHVHSRKRFHLGNSWVDLV